MAIHLIKCEVLNSSVKGGIEELKAEPVHYTVEELGSLPTKVKQEIEEWKNSLQKHESTVSYNDHTYLIIALGERPTGGYSVNVSKVEQRGSVLHVYAQEKTPAKGSMVIQVISYPLIVVSVKGNYSDDDVTFHVEYADDR